MDNTAKWGRPAMIRAGLGLALAGLMVTMLATVVQAAPGYQVTIPINTVVFADEGSVTKLAEILDLPEELAGQECDVIAHSFNQESVHPGNDLVVESGTSQVLLPDVEAGSNLTIEGIGTLVLGEDIMVFLHMGEDERFSGGFDVEIDCDSNDPTTTTTEATTTTLPEETTTTVAETTTTVEVEETSTTAPPETTTSSVEDTVLGTEVLPFTGAQNEWTVWIAGVLTVIGSLVVVAARRIEDEA